MFAQYLSMILLLPLIGWLLYLIFSHYHWGERWAAPDMLISLSLMGALIEGQLLVKSIKLLPVVLIALALWGLGLGGFKAITSHQILWKNYGVTWLKGSKWLIIIGWIILILVLIIN